MLDEESELSRSSARTASFCGEQSEANRSSFSEASSLSRWRMSGYGGEQSEANRSSLGDASTSAMGSFDLCGDLLHEEAEASSREPRL